MEAVTIRCKLQIAAVFAVVQQRFAVGAEQRKGQRVVILIAAMVAQNRFGFWQRGGLQATGIQRQQAFGEQHLLGIKQLINGVARLLPCAKGGAGSTQNN